MQIKDLEVIKKLDIEDGLTDLTYEEDFENMLNNDTITPKWVEENAIWRQLKGEPDEAYEAFKKYASLPIDKWEPWQVVGYDKATITAYLNAYAWKKRRLLYLKYTEWLNKRKSELEHFEAISNYRDTQAKVLKSTTRSSLLLIQKLQEKIEGMSADDIDARNIPQFISALANFVDLSADAEARALAVDKLMRLHAEDLTSLDINSHIAQLNAYREKI